MERKKKKERRSEYHNSGIGESILLLLRFEDIWFTDSCNFYTLERRGRDAHKRLKHVRAFIDRSTDIEEVPRRAGRWFMGFHNTAATFGGRFSPPYLCRWTHHPLRGKAARQLGGSGREEKERKEKKKKVMEL